MKKILVLDDNIDILQIVEEVLIYEHFSVKSIASSDGFFDVVRGFLPDLIILDYRLTFGNGAELCREIKSDMNLKHIPVIIFTAYLVNHSDFKEFGCDAVITKPFDIKELIEKIKTVLNLNNSNDA